MTQRISQLKLVFDASCDLSGAAVVRATQNSDHRIVPVYGCARSWEVSDRPRSEVKSDGSVVPQDRADPAEVEGKAHKIDRCAKNYR